MPRAESNRGLRSRLNAAGEEVWYVYLSIGGRMQHFGSVATAQAKAEERQGRFFPEAHKHQAAPMPPSSFSQYRRSPLPVGSGSKPPKARNPTSVMEKEILGPAGNVEVLHSGLSSHMCGSIVAELSCPIRSNRCLP